MATTSLWPIKATINNTIKYVENKSKTKKIHRQMLYQIYQIQLIILKIKIRLMNNIM